MKEGRRPFHLATASLSQKTRARITHADVAATACTSYHSRTRETDGDSSLNAGGFATSRLIRLAYEGLRIEARGKMLTRRGSAP